MDRNETRNEENETMKLTKRQAEVLEALKDGIYLKRTGGDGVWVLSGRDLPDDIRPSVSVSEKTVTALRGPGLIKPCKVRPGERFPNGTINTLRVSRYIWIAK